METQGIENLVITNDDKQANKQSQTEVRNELVLYCRELFLRRIEKSWKPIFTLNFAELDELATLEPWKEDSTELVKDLFFFITEERLQALQVSKFETIRILRWLLVSQLDDILYEGKKSKGASFHYLAYYNEVDLLDLLVKEVYKADELANRIDVQTPDGSTALHQAARGIIKLMKEGKVFDLKIVEILREVSIDFSKVDNAGRTAKQLIEQNVDETIWSEYQEICKTFSW